MFDFANAILSQCHTYSNYLNVVSNYITRLHFSVLGQYNDWVHIMPSATIVAVKGIVEIIGNFSHLPHGGISIYIDDSVSEDDDMSCIVNNDVLNKIVSYNCTAKRAGTKRVWFEVPFCGLDFRSETLNIIIMEEPGKVML